MTFDDALRRWVTPPVRQRQGGDEFRLGTATNTRGQWSGSALVWCEAVSGVHTLRGRWNGSHTPPPQPDLPPLIADHVLPGVQADWRVRLDGSGVPTVFPMPAWGPCVGDCVASLARNASIAAAHAAAGTAFEGRPQADVDADGRPSHAAPPPPAPTPPACHLLRHHPGAHWLAAVLPGVHAVSMTQHASVLGTSWPDVPAAQQPSLPAWLHADAAFLPDGFMPGAATGAGGDLPAVWSAQLASGLGLPARCRVAGSGHSGALADVRIACSAPTVGAGHDSGGHRPRPSLPLLPSLVLDDGAVVFTTEGHPIPLSHPHLLSSPLSPVRDHDMAVEVEEPSPSQPVAAPARRAAHPRTHHWTHALGLPLGDREPDVPVPPYLQAPVFGLAEDVDTFRTPPNFRPSTQCLLYSAKRSMAAAKSQRPSWDLVASELPPLDGVIAPVVRETAAAVMAASGSAPTRPPPDASTVAASTGGQPGGTAFVAMSGGVPHVVFSPAAAGERAATPAPTFTALPDGTPAGVVRYLHALSAPGMQMLLAQRRLSMAALERSASSVLREMQASTLQAQRHAGDAVRRLFPSSLPLIPTHPPAGQDGAHGAVPDVIPTPTAAAPVPPPPSTTTSGDDVAAPVPVDDRAQVDTAGTPTVAQLLHPLTGSEGSGGNGVVPLEEAAGAGGDGQAHHVATPFETALTAVPETVDGMPRLRVHDWSRSAPFNASHLRALLEVRGSVLGGQPTLKGVSRLVTDLAATTLALQVRELTLACDPLTAHCTLNSQLLPGKDEHGWPAAALVHLYAAHRMDAVSFSHPPWPHRHVVASVVGTPPPEHIPADRIVAWLPRSLARHVQLNHGGAVSGAGSPPSDGIDASTSPPATPSVWPSVQDPALPASVVLSRRNGFLFPAGAAHFGPVLTEAGVHGAALVLAEPLSGCPPGTATQAQATGAGAAAAAAPIHLLRQPSAAAGDDHVIAVVLRGGCSFVDKVAAAAAAGAAAVIVVDPDPVPAGSVERPPPSTTTPTFYRGGFLGVEGDASWRWAHAPADGPEDIGSSYPPFQPLQFSMGEDGTGRRVPIPSVFVTGHQAVVLLHQMNLGHAACGEARCNVTQLATLPRFTVPAGVTWRRNPLHAEYVWRACVTAASPDSPVASQTYTRIVQQAAAADTTSADAAAAAAQLAGTGFVPVHPTCTHATPLATVEALPTTLGRLVDTLFTER